MGQREKITVQLVDLPEPRNVRAERIGQGETADGKPVALFFEYRGEGGLRVDVGGRCLLLPYAELIDAVGRL